MFSVSSKSSSNRNPENDSKTRKHKETGGLQMKFSSSQLWQLIFLTIIIYFNGFISPNVGAFHWGAFLSFLMIIFIAFSLMKSCDVLQILFYTKCLNFTFNSFYCMIFIHTRLSLKSILRKNQSTILLLMSHSRKLFFSDKEKSCYKLLSIFVICWCLEWLCREKEISNDT